MGWYEAEAVPPNVLGGGAKIGTGVACPTGVPIKEGDMCQSAGHEVNNILGRNGASVTFNGISVPSDGMYDVTWWYHCGLNDNFGDKNCGGATSPPPTASGCRPHQLVVNGTAMPGTYHFPCSAMMWIAIHAATTALPLKAGNMNSIKISTMAPRDSADLDAIAIAQPGMGTPPLLTPNMDPLGH
jgi:hypothetical protein